MGKAPVRDVGTGRDAAREHWLATRSASLCRSAAGVTGYGRIIAPSVGFDSPQGGWDEATQSYCAVEVFSATYLFESAPTLR